MPCSFCLHTVGESYAEPIENMLIWLGAGLFQKHKTFARRYYHRLSPSLPRQVYRRQYQNQPPLHNTAHRCMIKVPCVRRNSGNFITFSAISAPRLSTSSDSTLSSNALSTGDAQQLICRRQIFAQRIDFRIEIIEKFNRRHRQYEFYDYPPLCNHAVYRLPSCLSILLRKLQRTAT